MGGRGIANVYIIIMPIHIIFTSSKVLLTEVYFYYFALQYNIMILVQDYTWSWDLP